MTAPLPPHSAGAPAPAATRDTSPAPATTAALERAERLLSSPAHLAAARSRTPRTLHGTALPVRSPHRSPGTGAPPRSSTTSATSPHPPTAPGRVVRRRPLRNAEPAPPSTWDRLRFQPSLPHATPQDDPSGVHESRRRSADQPLPDPVRTAQVVVTAALEVLAGWRPADHVARWASPELFDALARRAGLAQRVLGDAPAPRPRLRSLRAQLTLGGACEACAVLDYGERVRGAAARLEPHRGRWLLTHLEIA